MEAASGNQQTLAIPDQVTDQFFGILFMHQRPDRHLDGQILTGPAGTVSALAVFTPPGNKLACMTKVDQGIDGTVCFQINTAAITTITAIRPAEGNIFLAPETDCTVAAIAGTDFYGRFIDKFHGVTAVV
jgi:hypothetical protein